MEEKRIVISGFGGQGVVFAGKLLVEAAMRSGLYATYFPSYGIAMRGGAAKCDVTVSGEEIGSPVIDEADIVIAMSVEAKRRYEPLVKKEGVFILNSSLVKEDPERGDVAVVKIDATERAARIGNKMVATLICLGRAAAFVGGVSLESFYSSLEAKVEKFGEEILAYNKRALEEGWSLK